MEKKRWTKTDMPSQSGKIAIVTGANTGLGYETALGLYEAGAHVIIASRSAEKAEEAIEKIRASGGKGTLAVGIIDLADLSSVQEFSENFKQKHQQLDLLINNAGIMFPPAGKTADGFELHFGTNFIGHFALTGHLYELLKKTPGSRIVTLSSGAYKWVEKFDFDNLQLEKTYDPIREYAASKFADLMFALELQKLITASGDKIISVAAHPGVTRTDLQRHIDPVELQEKLNAYEIVMEPSQGALPELYAATSADVKGGEYYGPDGEKELSGYPGPAFINDTVKDSEVAQKLWKLAEQRTGIVYPS